jgi:glyoxylate/hydroxypyruvate reductase
MSAQIPGSARRRISCAFSDDSIALQWVQALQKRLPPNIEATLWQPDAPPADYAVAWHPSQGFLDSQPRLKALFVAGAGVDAVSALERLPDCLLVRIEDAGMGLQMAQYVAYGALGFARGFDAYEAQAQRAIWREHIMPALDDLPVGIMGVGVLGLAIAQSLQALGFQVHGWVRTPRVPQAMPIYAGQDGLEDFLRATRILVCALPLTPETRQIINARHLSCLPGGSFVINVARGGHVDEPALIQALDSGHIAGALLDVCAIEPAPSDHPFWSHPKIRLTPHIAASTLIGPSADQIVEKIKRLERGETISGVVQARGY